MACIRGGKTGQGSADGLNQIGKKVGGPKSIIQIYTDWANHYLEKVKSKRRIQDLQTDIIDGVALADVIEAVTSHRICDVNRKPKTTAQMCDNVTKCLSYVESIGVPLDGICAKDIKDGNLKTVLSLFFALSRYKQQQKQLLQQAKQAQMTHTPELSHRPMATTQQRSLPVKSASGIPSPMSTPTKKPPDRKGQLIPPSVGIPGNGPSNLRPPTVHSESSSRSTSPSHPGVQQQTGISQPKSIPAPRGRIGGASAHGPTRGSQKITPVTPPTVPNNSSTRIKQQTQLPSQKGSMLEKLKMFKPPPEKPKSSGSKRTSSSSGFSSARSERSDSSTSLCNEPKNLESDNREESLTPTPDSILNSGPRNKAKVPRGKIGKPSPTVKQVSPKVSRGREDHGLRVSKSGSRSGSGSRERSEHSSERPSSRDRHEERHSKSRERDLISIKDYGPLDNLPGPEIVCAPVKQSHIATRTEKQSNRRSIPQPTVKEPVVASNDAMTSSGSGIPKPTALVKGTSKVVSETKCATVTAKPPLKRTPSQKVNVETERPIQNSDSGTSLSVQGSKSQISSPANTLPRQKSRCRELDGSNVALVSPMPSSSGSSASSSSPQAAPASSYGEKEGDGADQYCEDAESPRDSRKLGAETQKFSRKDGTQEVEEKKKSEASTAAESNLGEEAEDVLMSIKPMQPLNRNSPYGYIRSLAMSTRHMAPSLHTQKVAFQVDGNRNSHTFPNGFEPLKMPHGFRRQYLSTEEYADQEGLEIPSGYVSDGDILRAPHSLPSTCRKSDVSDISANGDSLDGYLSEGGASLYARRLASLQNGRKKPDDSYDDSSSIASSISDCLNELSHRESETKITTQNMLTSGMDHNPIHAGLATPILGRKERSDSGRTNKRALDPTRAASVDRCLQIDARRAPDYQRLKAEQVRERSDSRERRRQRADDGQSGDDKVKRERKFVGRKDPGDDDKSGLSYLGGGAQGITNLELPRGEPSTNVPRSVVDGRRVHAVKGVPPSFGYIKRSNSGAKSKEELKKEESKTAQVSVVPKLENGHSLERPRTKLKCSSGIQTTGDLNSTCSDSEYASTPYGQRISQLKSYSLTTPTANQLSQNIRERLLSGTQSLPKNNQTNALMMTMMMAGVNYQPVSYQGRRRGNTDGSLSDTPYYGEPKTNQYLWTRNSNGYGTSGPESILGGDSLDSLSSGSMMSCSNKGQMALKNQVFVQREMSPSPRLSRSNSMRSSKSDKIYSALIQRVEDMENVETMDSVMAQRLYYPTNPMNSSPSSQSYGRSSFGNYGVLPTKLGTREDECHASSLSLVSTASSLYSTQEEKQAAEIRKLRKELMEAQTKVNTLSGQLSTNAHVVSAFEQSLSNMTNRLQQLHLTSEQKDNELSELRSLIENLRKQGIDAGMQLKPLDTTGMPRQASNDSVASLTSHSSASSSANTTALVGGQPHSNLSGEILDIRKDGKKKSWLRSSFTKAFSRSRRIGKTGAVEDDPRGGAQTDGSAPSSPLLSHVQLRLKREEKEAFKGSRSSLNLDLGEGEDLNELKKLLREKDMVLTDIRLEALSSAHQLDALKETVNKMKNEMMTLKQDNERLQRLVSSKSLGGSASSVGHGQDRRLSVPELAFAVNPGDILFGEPLEKDSRPIKVFIYLGSHGCLTKYQRDYEDFGLHVRETRSLDRQASKNYNSEMPSNPSVCPIGYVSVAPLTRWEALEDRLKKVFQEYLNEIDPTSSLGISADCVYSYHFGEVSQVFIKAKAPVLESNSPLQQLESAIDACTGQGVYPELLPFGYLIGEVDRIFVALKGAKQEESLDAMVFETLIQKPILKKFLGLLRDHRRLALCGPSGTGKSYIAQKMAEFLMYSEEQETDESSVIAINIDQERSKEIKTYLLQVVSEREKIPVVVVLDNLHSVGALIDVLNSGDIEKFPYVIGTACQPTRGKGNLHSLSRFRWIPYANHLEPVKGFLSRYMRRRLIETELKAQARLPDLKRVLDWVPRVWQHLNRFIENHSSAEATIGPKIFMACPAHLTGSQVWFRDLWNYTVVSYLVEAVKEGLQLYGKRSNWVDPAQFVYESYPWAYGAMSGTPEGIMRIRPEDVGEDNFTTGVTNLRTRSISEQDSNEDPLLNMLITLQEAANYTNPYSNNSDSTGSSRQSPGSNPSIDSIG